MKLRTSKNISLKVDARLKNKIAHKRMRFVGRVGLEPTRCLHRRILSPLRLPIPPPPLTYIILSHSGVTSRLFDNFIINDIKRFRLLTNIEYSC